MTREFFKFVKTHPRKGKVERRIAFLEGRYAAPFNGFICDCEQTPDYSVWGRFGNNAPEWGHRQPEKCRQVLDVLMPGASTQPLRQQFDRRRFFFSGTPYGDFDEVPAEVTAEYLKQYKLLLNLGWNTMIAEDYDKLLEFVGLADTGKKIVRTENEIRFSQIGETLVPYQLSSGEKQMLAILLTVLVEDNQHYVLFMDEPEVSLHIEWQKRLIDLCVELNPNVQIILTTHSPAVVMNGWMDAVTEVTDITL